MGEDVIRIIQKNLITKSDDCRTLQEFWSEYWCETVVVNTYILHSFKLETNDRTLTSFFVNRHCHPDQGSKIFQTREAGPRGNAEGWRRPRRGHRSCPPQAEARPGFTNIISKGCFWFLAQSIYWKKPSTIISFFFKISNFSLSLQSFNCFLLFFPKSEINSPSPVILTNLAQSTVNFDSCSFPCLQWFLFKIIIKYVADICAFLQFRLL